MFKVSQLISLPVINIFNLKIEGYIEKTYFNTEQKRLEYVKVYDETSDIYKTVKFNDILSISNSAIFIRNSSKITLFENTEYLIEKLASPINAQTFILSEDYVGNLTEIFIDNKGVITSLIVNDKEYSPCNIIGMSNSLILLSLNKKISINKYKPYTKKIKSPSTHIGEPIVTILNSQITTQKETNYSFLLNRKILKDIKNQNGEIIAHQNTIVKTSTLNKLKYYGKLKELMLNCK